MAGTGSVENERPPGNRPSTGSGTPDDPFDFPIVGSMPRPDSLIIAILLTALAAFGPLSTDLYLPTLPTLVEDFASDPATVQLTLSLFLVGYALSQLVYGPLSDRFGRRPVLLGGITIFVTASAACLAAQTIDQLLAARLLQAVGACSGPVLARAVVRDVHGRDQAARLFAYMAMAMAVAPAVGPILGGYLTQLFGWRACFAALTLFGAAILMATWAGLDESNRHLDPQAIRPGRLLTNYRALLGHRPYLGYVLAASLCYCGIFAFISGSAFVLMGTVGLSPAEYGMSFALTVLGYMTGAFGAGRLTVRLGVDRMIVLGTMVASVGGVAGMALAQAGVVTLPAIVAPMAVFMAGAGLTLPNAMAGAVGPFPTMTGLASALLGFMQMGMAAGVGIAVSHVQDGSPQAMMTAIALAALAALIAHRALVGTGVERPE